MDLDLLEVIGPDAEGAGVSRLSVVVMTNDSYHDSDVVPSRELHGLG